MLDQRGQPRFKLTLISGVAPMNDNLIGLFRCPETAHMVGNLLLALDKSSHPEYSHHVVEDLRDA